MNKIKKYLRDKSTEIVEEAVDKMFVDLHTMARTKSGDIYPEQEFELRRLQRQLAEILYRQTLQNL